MHDTVASCTQTAAELRLFAGSEVWIVSLDLNESAPPHQNISTAKVSIPGRIDPIEIKNAIVDRTLRVELSAMPPYSGNVLVGFKDFEGCRHKMRVEDRIAVKKEDVRCGRPLPACVPGSRGGLDSSMKNDDLGIEIAGGLWTSVG
jgi:hypothetical protein